MKVSEAMSRDVRFANPRQTLQTAAMSMIDIDAGVLPVGENDRLVGMITDRDIAVRGVALGKGPHATVAEVMSSDVKYCYDDQDMAEAARYMAELKVRRLPVLNRDKRVVGIVSLGDIAVRKEGEKPAGGALSSISEPGGEHSQG